MDHQVLGTKDQEDRLPFEDPEWRKILKKLCEKIKNQKQNGGNED